MCRHFRYILLTQILCWISCDGASKSHYGTEFLLGMIPNHRNEDPNIIIDIASEAPGLVQLYVPLLNLNRTETLHKGHTSLRVDHSLIQRGNFTAKRSIQIHTTVPVSIYVTSSDTDNTKETYMALPTTSFGSIYMVASFQPVDSSEKTEIMLISNFNNTSVNISRSGQVHINKIEVSQMEYNSDITGIIISSTKPVGVISGTTCANIPHNVVACDIIVEQLVPVSAWTQLYIVPPLPPKSGYLVRVQAMDELQVCFINSSQQICDHVSQRAFKQYQFGMEPTVIYSTGSLNFGVIQYGTGYNFGNKGGDPFMTVIPGVQNFVTSYYFVVPSVYSNFTNYLTVTVKTSEKDGLLLDGKSLKFAYKYTAITPLDQYVVLVTNITTGYHILTHSDKLVDFGATLYGLAYGQGYGYPAGIKYPNEETLQPTRTQKCYHCNEMTSLEVCDVVQSCSDTEMCFAERFTARSGTFYRSGCMNKTNCPSGNRTTSTNGVCLDCCHGNYCNNKGCGDHSFPDRVHRGPMCYDCQHVLNDTDLCMKVTMCGIDEVCSIEKYRWGKDYHYKMGCTHRLCTPMKRSLLPKRLRRSTPLCSSCCSDDFCNTNCTQTTDGSTGEIIVG